MGGFFYALAILIAVLIVGVLVIGAIASWVLIQREDYISSDDDKCTCSPPDFCGNYCTPKRILHERTGV